MGCEASNPLRDYLRENPGNYGKSENLDRAYIIMTEHFESNKMGQISQINKIDYIEKSRSIEIGESHEWKMRVVFGDKNLVETFCIWLNSDPKAYEIKKAYLMGCIYTSRVKEYLDEHQDAKFGKEEDIEKAFNHLQEHLNLFNYGEITQIKRLAYDGEKINSSTYKEYQEWRMEVVYGSENKIKGYKVRLFSGSQGYEVQIHNFDE